MVSAGRGNSKTNVIWNCQHSTVFELQKCQFLVIDTKTCYSIKRLTHFIQIVSLNILKRKTLPHHFSIFSLYWLCKQFLLVKQKPVFSWEHCTQSRTGPCMSLCSEFPSWLCHSLILWHWTTHLTSQLHCPYLNNGENFTYFRGLFFNKWANEELFNNFHYFCSQSLHSDL